MCGHGVDHRRSQCHRCKQTSDQLLHDLGPWVKLNPSDTLSSLAELVPGRVETCPITQTPHGDGVVDRQSSSLADSQETWAFTENNPYRMLGDKGCSLARCCKCEKKKIAEMEPGRRGGRSSFHKDVSTVLGLSTAAVMALIQQWDKERICLDCKCPDDALFQMDMISSERAKLEKERGLWEQLKHDIVQSTEPKRNLNDRITEIVNESHLLVGEQVISEQVISPNLAQKESHSKGGLHKMIEDNQDEFDAITQMVMENTHLKKQIQERPAVVEKIVRVEQSRECRYFQNNRGSYHRGLTTCSICMENPPDHVFLDCGHIALCGNCVAGVQTCPICRQVVVGFKKVFIV
jgi:hypothetical protein